MLYESREAVIRLFNDYSPILSEIKYKNIHGKVIPSMLARIPSSRVPKVSNLKDSDHSNLSILSSKQMLQRLPILLAQVKAGNTSENLLNKIRQILYYLYRTKAY